ncbi:MAG: DUF1501 domain-containing protein [Pirellulaceae bacterium]|nr:DUF1501 domain-containing protein [Pirellulaceae bacterium]
MTTIFSPPRRDFLYGLGLSLGSAALSSLLQAEEKPAGPLAPKPGHHAAKAKACISLFMEGGPSHIDTFDPKPKLADLHMQEFSRQDKFASAMASGKRYYVKSPFQFRAAGKSGLVMCDRFEHLAKVADHLCVYKGLQVDSVDHPTACYQMNTGNRFGGDPAVGAWATYGLGSESQNLPAFVVLPEGAYPQGGAANWSNGFLPAYYQGTPLRPGNSPILDLSPAYGMQRDRQRANLDLLAELNRADQVRNPHHGEVAARMEAYELAFRMQAEVPGIVDLSNEDQQTLDSYGIGQPETDSFGRRCLLARKLVAAGVRFVQIFEAGWDSHDYIERAHTQRIKAIDQPIAALISDLARLGLLDSTLVVWGGEFGRSPDNGVRGGGNVAGRDHNAKAMSVWLAGGGVRGGRTVGATDELGAAAVETVHHVRDFHVTLLHLLGLSDNKLTYFHEGRYKQLSQVGGEVIQELVG